MTLLAWRERGMGRTLLIAAAVCVGLSAAGCGKKDAPATDSAAGSFTDGRDGQTYKIAKIGEQTWMAANLNYRTESGSWCYGGDDSKCAQYGRLYDWETAKSVCPAGWKLPDTADWNTLAQTVGSNQRQFWDEGSFVVLWDGAGKKLKSKNGWNQNGNGTDDYGFSALPGGYGRSDGAGSYGYWWTATENERGTAAFRRHMNYNNDMYGSDHDGDAKGVGLSVRCLMGAPTPEISETKGMMPDKKYIGTWHDAYNPPNDLTILEVDSTIKFELSVHRITVTIGTAKIENGKITFVTDCNWSGIIEFNENSILLTIDKSGPELASGTAFNFTVRDAPQSEKPEQASATKDAEQFTDDRDGQKYKTVKLGERTWMAANLNYQTKSGSWCYENKADNCKQYGRLYDWKTAKTVCPAGWKLPSRQDWDNLGQAVGGVMSIVNQGLVNWSGAGKKLKARSGWNENGNGTDDFGFSALPGGFRSSDDGFGYVGRDGGWWTSEEFGSGSAYGRGMGYGYDELDEYFRNEGDGLSVRCVAD